MSQYDNTNKGALFGNEKQREGKKDPDLQGKLNINGVEHWISGWFFTYDKGGSKRKAISLALGAAVGSQGDAVPKKQTQPEKDDMADDIPF